MYFGANALTYQGGLLQSAFLKAVAKQHAGNGQLYRDDSCSTSCRLCLNKTWFAGDIFYYIMLSELILLESNLIKCKLHVLADVHSLFT